MINPYYIGFLSGIILLYYILKRQKNRIGINERNGTNNTNTCLKTCSI